MVSTLDPEEYAKTFQATSAFFLSFFFFVFHLCFLKRKYDFLLLAHVSLQVKINNHSQFIMYPFLATG